MIKLKSYGTQWVGIGFVFLSMAGTVQLSGAQSLRGPHPYLMYTQVDIEQFESRLGASASDEATFDALVKNAENMHVPQSEAAMETACLAFRVTGRQEFSGYIKAGLEKFDQDRISAMRRCSNVILHGTRDWEPQALVAAYGLGFDCIHEQLTPAERKHFADALVSKGLLALF